MKEKIITFRPTAETTQSLNQLKEQGSNISAYINQAIMNYEQQHYTRTIHTIPATNDCPDLKQATPLSMLGIKHYKEAIDIIRANGFDFQVFTINYGEHPAIALLSSCRLTATIDFNRYYSIIDGKTTRTSLPLPTILYHRPTRTVIHITYTPVIPTRKELP